MFRTDASDGFHLLDALDTLDIGGHELELGYLDHAASTPWRPEARAAFAAAVDVGAANASGSHRAARRARALVDDAREALAGVLGVDAGDVVFTSGGTESNDLAVRGRWDAVRGRVVCTAIEHPAVLEAVRALGGSTVGVDGRGLVDPGALAVALDGDVTLVSVMTVNNEVGVVQPVAELAELVRRRRPGAAFHTDAVQALPWVDLRDVAPHVDLLSLSAHKFGGPQGVGACVVRRGTELAARHLGGGQERERRSGTHNVAGIVAMAAAAVACDAARASEVPRLAALRDRLAGEIVAALPGVVVTPGGAAGFAHLCVEGVDSEALVFLLDDAGVCASAASACASGAQHPSHVLAAMGIGREQAAGALRMTLGHTTSDADVDLAVGAVVAAVERLRRFPR